MEKNNKKTFIQEFVGFIMPIKRVFIISLFLIILEISLASASFACGYVNDSEKLSASWIEVMVYYDENPSDSVICKTSPENKFCCDLEQITSVTWETGKMVHAEVFNPELGYVAGPVSLFVTGEGYDVFPDMELKKAINFKQPLKTILVNDSEVFFNLSLGGNYNNLKYKLGSKPEQGVCEDCSEPGFYIPNLEKGENEIELIAYNDVLGKNVSENFRVYSLDYLNILDSFECTKCKTIRNKVYVPSSSDVDLKLTLNASHNISGILNIYIPVDWSSEDDLLLEDYSPTHDKLKWKINDSSIASITIPLISSKIWFKRRDVFKYEISDFLKQRTVYIYRLTRIFPFSRHSSFTEDLYFENSLDEIASPIEPLILDSNEEIFEVVAIYPTENLENAHAYIIYKERRFFGRKYINFNLISNIPNTRIDKILFRFKIPKGKNFNFYKVKESVALNEYNQDSEYIYYEVYVGQKSFFKAKIY
jgi:hypothetical protein